MAIDGGQQNDLWHYHEAAEQLVERDAHRLVVHPDDFDGNRVEPFRPLPCQRDDRLVGKLLTAYVLGHSEWV